jgi:hypothetical protein
MDGISGNAKLRDAAHWHSHREVVAGTPRRDAVHWHQLSN